MMRFAALALIFAFPFFAQAANYSFGVGITHYDYSEFLTAPSKSNETGLFPSFHAKYNSKHAGEGPGFLWGATLDSSLLANLRYDGSTLSSGSGTTTPVTTTNIHYFGFLEAFMGWAFYFGNWQLRPYVGLGYRLWNRYLTYGTGYREIYAWTYQITGLNVSFPVSDDIFLDFDASYRPMLNGSMKIIFSEFVSTGQDSEVTLGRRSGYRLATGLQSSFLANWRLFSSLWYEHSEIGQSNVVYNATPISGGGVLGFIYEPESRTNQFGIQMGVGKTF